ncbi:MAG: glycerophosphodiester phosphodiesterase family protein [Pseudoruegeria sp.]
MTKLRPLTQVISPDNTDLMIISHRGEWSVEPENSIAGMTLAASMGADMVELDVQRTNEGILYLMHDDTTDRMTNRIGDTTSVMDDEFETLVLRRAAGGPNALLTRVPVPSLRDALEAARGRVHLNIDTKHRRDLEAVGDLVFQMGMQDQVLIKMVVDPTDPDLTIRDASWFRGLTFMPVMLDPRPGKMAQDAVELVRQFDAKIIEISFLSLDELDETTNCMRALGVRMWCNTLDPVHPLDYSDARALKSPDDVWGTLMCHGIGAIQTDQTTALSRYIGRS